MTNVQKYDRLLDDACKCPKQESKAQESAKDTPRPSGQARSAGRGLLQFFAELRRRHVCRAATVYAVVFWLICQVVATIAPELSMPVWTTKFVIIVGLIGFPIALVISWLVDVTPQGIVVEHKQGANEISSNGTQKRRPFDHALDCSLVLAALVIGAQLATGFLSTDSNAAQPVSPKIAVLSTQTAWGDDVEEFAEGLFAQIQHELVSKSVATVVAPLEDYLTEDCYRLTITVAAGDQLVRITATLIDNKNGFINWSRVFTHSRDEALSTQADLANDVVDALPIPFRISSAAEAAPGASHVR